MQRDEEIYLLEDILSLYAERFFLGCEIIETTPFRVTRDADLDIDDDAEDLLAEVVKSLKNEKRGCCTP